VEFSGRDASLIQGGAQLLQLSFVSDREMDVGRVEVRWTTVLIGMFNSCVGSLNGLLREWNVAAGDGIKVVLRNLLHDDLSS
jgi:hypothetical protein